MINGAIALSSMCVLFASGLASFALGFVFWRRAVELKRLWNVSVRTVYDRSFNVYDPFPSSRRLIHSLLSLMPLLSIGLTFAALFVFFAIASAGLIVALILGIACANLLVVDGASDIYGGAKVFRHGFQKGVAFAEGDLTVLDVVKSASRKLGNYYFMLSFFLVTISLLVGFVRLLPASQFFDQSIMFLGAVSESPPLMLILVWGVFFTAASVLLRRVRDRFLGGLFTCESAKA